MSVLLLALVDSSKAKSLLARYMCSRFQLAFSWDRWYDGPSGGGTYSAWSRTGVDGCALSNHGAYTSPFINTTMTAGPYPCWIKVDKDAPGLAVCRSEWCLGWLVKTNTGVLGVAT